MKFFPVAGLMLSQVTPSLGDAKQCAADVIALMQKDKHALGHKTLAMLKVYNNTCVGNDLCEFNLDENTESYLQAATVDDVTPNLPEVPMIGSAVADFEGFASHASFLTYVDACLTEGGHVKFVDTNLRLKGTAMDLVDVDLEAKLQSFPVCLVEGCEDEDLEEVLEEAVKYAVIENANELSKQQQTVINGMNIALACAASGIEKCKLRITESDDLGILSKSSTGSSGATTIPGHATVLIMTAFGIWAVFSLLL